MAAVSSILALSDDFSLMEALTFLITLFTCVRFDLLRRFLTVFCLARLMADLCVANVSCSFLKFKLTIY